MAEVTNLPTVSMVPPSRAQIKINAVNRLIKEHELYIQELGEIETKIQSLTSSNGDEYELKKLNQVRDETKRVAPRVKTSIEKSLQELKDLQVEGEEKTAAQEAIKKAQNYLSQI